FFFSSRRRHTSFSRDWSSDVCSSDLFVENNVKLILNVLEYAKEVEPKIFLQMSTDEVFGPAPEGYSHHEWDKIKPSNPYSASKAAQEAIAYSYWRAYN